MSNEKMTGRFNRNTAKETEEQSMAFDSQSGSSLIQRVNAFKNILKKIMKILKINEKKL